MSGLHVTTGLLTTGATVGLGYGTLAAGLVLVYRSSRVVNFAHGEIGAIGAAVLAKLVVDEHVPWLVALPLALLIGAAAGAIVELVVVRRLEKAPRVLVLIATIGVAELLLVAQHALPRTTRNVRFPTPIHVSIGHGSVILDGPALTILAVVPAVVAGLALLLTRTPTGRAIRALADNREAAALAGIPARRVSTVVWATSGALAALTVVLLDPILGANPAQPSPALGPGLLLRALAAALVGGLVSLPWALVGGVLVGMAEAPLYDSYGAGGVDLFLLVVVLVLVLLRGSSRDDESDVALPSGRLSPVPAALRSTWWAPRLPLLGWAGLSGTLALLPLVLGAGSLLLPTKMLLLAMLGLSLVVLTGWSGQVSLGQAALFGVGAWVTYALVQRHVPFAAAVLEGTIAGVLVALLLGLPSLRVRGLFLAITTLAFAIAAQSWLFHREVLAGDPNVTYFLTRPEWIRGDRAYYWMSLSVLVLAATAVGRLRRTGVARTAIAVRSNERRATALALSPVASKLTAFAISGALAALAGGLFAGLRLQLGPSDFGVYDSLAVVALVVIGGAGSPAGAVLGALYVAGIPALFGSNTYAVAASSGIGLLVLLLYFPGGFAEIVERGRKALLTRVAAGRANPDANADETSTANSSSVVTPRPRPGVPGSPSIEGQHITVAFGGRRALDDVNLVAQDGEILGLIGANGAGKSTLLSVLSGHLRADVGVVAMRGLDVSELTANRRAALGLGRVFQDARLFGDLTVTETVLLSLEAADRTDLVPAVLALPPYRAAERRKLARAHEVVDLLGLGAFANQPVRELSTGTRRVVEIACLVGQGARTLLLDEPTAGLAQRETEAFGPLLVQLRQDLSATIVLVEHDLPLVMSVCDRVQCLGVGRTIALGTPGQVRNDAAVIASYLGTDDRVILRSGAGATPTRPARKARVRAGAK